MVHSHRIAMKAHVRFEIVTIDFSHITLPNGATVEQSPERTNMKL